MTFCYFGAAVLGEAKKKVSYHWKIKSPIKIRGLLDQVLIGVNGIMQEVQN